MSQTTTPFDQRAPKSDRFKQMLISYGTMMRLITGEVLIVNMPDWTRLVSCEHDFIRRCFVCIIEHISFPKVPLGEYPTSFIAEFKEIKCKTGEPRKLTFN